jgi:FAD:protein FMN transferase
MIKSSQIAMPDTSFYAMGSQITISLSKDSPEIQAALRQIRSWYQRCEKTLSRFLATSELSRLNEQSGQSVTVSPLLGSVLRAALRGANQTGGLVSPTLLEALESAGYDRSFEKINPTNIPNRPAPASSGLDTWRSIQLEVCDRQYKVRVPPGLRLELGGFAKGWAADRSAHRLGRIAPALVNAGGDIAVSGPSADGLPWQVGIGRPEDPSRQLAVLPLLRGGVATSGRNYRRWKLDGRELHHLIDPRTGLPAATDVVTASVIAPSALQAEIGAKAVFILGSRVGLEWLAARPRLAGILVLESGAILCTPGLEPYLR